MLKKILSFFHKEPKTIPLDEAHAKMQERLFKRAFELNRELGWDEITDLFFKLMSRYETTLQHIKERDVQPK
jgi:hypothetical protein